MTNLILKLPLLSTSLHFYMILLVVLRVCFHDPFGHFFFSSYG